MSSMSIKANFCLSLKPWSCFMGRNRGTPGPFKCVTLHKGMREKEAKKKKKRMNRIKRGLKNKRDTKAKQI